MVMNMKKTLKSVVVIALGLILIAVLFGMVPRPPVVCPLHERVPSNFPIIVNTSEGSASELRLYNTFSEYPLQIVEKSEYGVMWMVAGKGWSGAAFPDNNYLHFSIQKDSMCDYSNRAARKFFCDECVNAFKELDPSCNFVVVDAYENDNLKYHDIADIEELQIRHYSFVAGDTGEGLLSFEMHSSYYNGGKELDFLDKDTTQFDNHYEGVIDQHTNHN